MLSLSLRILRSLLPSAAPASLDSALICLCTTFAFTAVALSVGSVSWCEFVEFELPGGATPAFGAWRYQSFALVTVNGDLYKVDGCGSMPNDWDLDTKWMSSRVFGILAPLMGILAGLALLKSAKLSAILFFFTTMFQGLTLLLLKSDLCSVETNPAFASYQDALGDVSDCKIGRSAVVSIVGTAFFFLAGVLALMSGVSASKEDSDDEVPASGDGEKGEEQP